MLLVDRHDGRIMPVRLHHAVLSCVVTRGAFVPTLTNAPAQEMHCWLTVHLKLRRRAIFHIPKRRETSFSDRVTQYIFSEKTNDVMRI